MVVAGIFVGNTVQRTPAGKLSIKLHKTLHLFWEIIDDILNAVLFLLIGFELLATHAAWQHWILVTLAIPMVLIVRFITVALPITLLQRHKMPEPYTITILTWGGLRGGLAVALALSLPPSTYRDLILALTFAVVAFSVIVQGLSIKPLAGLANRKKANSDREMPTQPPIAFPKQNQ